MNNSSVRSFAPDLRPDKTIGRNLNCRKRRLDRSFIHIRKHVRESSFNMTRGGVKILRGGSENF